MFTCKVYEILSYVNCPLDEFWWTNTLWKFKIVLAIQLNC